MAVAELAPSQQAAQSTNTAERDSNDQSPLPPGTRVEVVSTLDNRWAKGFEVVSGSKAGYRLRRLSDGTELPGRFGVDDVRKERRRDMWWY